jgi:hypothetical protein
LDRRLRPAIPLRGERLSKREATMLLLGLLINAVLIGLIVA